MVSFESIDELDAAGVLTLKTHSPSTLRWRLRGQVTHIHSFEATAKPGAKIGLTDSRRYRDLAYALLG